MNINKFLERAEIYVIEIMGGRKKTFRDKCFRAFLFSLSRLYRGVVQLRLTLYSERMLRQRMLGCLVVSVGNLTVGGTGKTPVVEVFAKTLAANGRTVAILSRGYRSKKRPLLERIKNFFLKKTDDIPPRLVSDGENLLLDSELAGDEPYMLASNLPGVMVVVDKDRVKAGKYAIRELGADTLILDDGFQYLRFKPRINICLIDSTNPFHNHHVLPRGLLREPIKNLRRADYIFLTKSNGSPKLRHLKQFIRRHNASAEIIECTHRPKYLLNIENREREDIGLLNGKKVAAISGIARPESFEEFLLELGSELVHTEQFIDHHRYSKKELEKFIKKSITKGADMIVTTEKDAVRFPELINVGIPIYYLRVEIDILSGEESFNDCINRMCFL